MNAATKHLFTTYTPDEVAKLIDYGSEKKEKLSDAMTRLLQVKSKIRLFDGIDDRFLPSVVTNVNFVQFKAGQAIVKQGDTSKELFLVLRGECGIYVGKEKIGVVKAGQVIGEVAGIFNKKRNATIIALKENSMALSFAINDKNIANHAKQFVELYRNLAKELSIKLEDLNNKYTKQCNINGEDMLV